MYFIGCLQNTTNKNNNKTIATITHDGAFVAIVV